MFEIRVACGKFLSQQERVNIQLLSPVSGRGFLNDLSLQESLCVFQDLGAANLRFPHANLKTSVNSL